MSRRISLILLAATLAVATLGAETDTMKVSKSPVVTFIELGSVNCVPCGAMRGTFGDAVRAFLARRGSGAAATWFKRGCGALALVSDAAHVFLDIFALALSYGALRPGTCSSFWTMHRSQRSRAIDELCAAREICWPIDSET
jgi:hypothetical protein